VVAGQQRGLDQLAVQRRHLQPCLPSTWNGYWQMGAVLMLTQLKPVPAK
jgi:hypothetical protein